MKNLFLAIATICFLTTSCNQTKKVVETSNNELLDGSFTILTIQSKSINPTATLRFTDADKAIGGDTGCNSFGGNYSVDNQAINIGLLMATEAYCDEPIMKNERTIFKALKNTGTYSISEGVLTLFSKADRSILLTAAKK